MKLYFYYIEDVPRDLGDLQNKIFNNTVNSTIYIIIYIIIKYYIVKNFNHLSKKYKPRTAIAQGKEN